MLCQGGKSEELITRSSIKIKNINIFTYVLILITNRKKKMTDSHVNMLGPTSKIILWTPALMKFFSL
jgi:hypothetical protein